MFYLLLRAIWEDYQDGIITEEEYQKAVIKLSYLHDKKYDVWHNAVNAYLSSQNLVNNLKASA